VGEGSDVDLAVGGALGSRHAVFALRGKVVRVHKADPVGGDIAVIASGGVRTVLTTRRKPYHVVRDLQALGLDPARHDLTVVKIGYLVPDLFAAAKGWVLALTPGGVDQNIVRLGHARLLRPLYPFDPDMTAPNLAPELLSR
jgi:microcystin degradation protein MlrC